MRDRSATVFFTVGACFVVFGGLVAAFTGPLQLADGSWAAAFLVLVSGVAQCALGVAQSELAPRPPSRAVFWVELLCWNLGCLAVIGGVVLASAVLVDAGGALLVVTLALMIRAASASRTDKRWLLWGYRALIAILIVSIPIGLIIAAVRGG